MMQRKKSSVIIAQKILLSQRFPLNSPEVEMESRGAYPQGYIGHQSAIPCSSTKLMLDQFDSLLQALRSQQQIILLKDSAKVLRL